MNSNPSRNASSIEQLSMATRPEAISASPLIPRTTRERIEAQGFCGCDDRTYTLIDMPLRVAPAICMFWTAAGTLLASPTALWALAPFAALGAILPGHPFDVFYQFGLRHVVGRPALPRYRARRRFACALATVMLVAAAGSFQVGLPLAGNIFGWSLVVAAFVNVITGICVPSFFVRLCLGTSACQPDIVSSQLPLNTPTGVSP
ncbi:hypothetical protein LBMAG53_24950 [Planctomycetota bacterium]|nr:hypothetical protein LBMAG53_24950 [Planctomycetota bacterium]